MERINRALLLSIPYTPDCEYYENDSICILSAQDISGEQIIFANNICGLCAEAYIARTHPIFIDGLLAIRANGPYIFCPWCLASGIRCKSPQLCSQCVPLFAAAQREMCTKWSLLSTVLIGDIIGRIMWFLVRL